jgi:hypothetical protein
MEYDLQQGEAMHHQASKGCIKPFEDQQLLLQRQCLHHSTHAALTVAFFKELMCCLICLCNQVAKVCIGQSQQCLNSKHMS